MENNDSIHENDVEEDNTLMYIYEWVDSVPLSRQKKNIARDFNDGVLLAEMIKYHYPKLVDLHNYPSSSSTEMKMSNWNTLNHKVLKKLGLTMLSIAKQELLSCCYQKCIKQFMDCRKKQKKKRNCT